MRRFSRNRFLGVRLRLLREEHAMSFFTTATQHFYPGGGACNGSSTCTTQAQATSEMLSSAWVTGTNNTSTEACGTSTFLLSLRLSLQQYAFTDRANTNYPYRLTELNEYDLGTVGASNAFTAALWALDVMHWFAGNHAAGTNFHNNPWIPTDTIIPGDLTQYTLNCPSTEFRLHKQCVQQLDNRSQGIWHQGVRSERTWLHSRRERAGDQHA